LVCKLLFYTCRTANLLGTGAGSVRRGHLLWIAGLGAWLRSRLSGLRRLSALRRLLLLLHERQIVVAVRHSAFVLEPEVARHRAKNVRAALETHDAHVDRVRRQLQELELAHAILFAFDGVVDALDVDHFVAAEHARLRDHDHVEQLN
jgi:hypothetical protein